MSTPPTDAVWQERADSLPGPALVRVLARLRDTPPAFLDPRVDLAALVHDAVGLVDAAPDGRPSAAAVLAGLRDDPDPGADLPPDPAARAATALGCWLVTEPEVAARLPRPRHERVAAGLSALAALAAAAPPHTWLAGDEDRSEEVARALLRGLGLRPDGESHAVAEDRWAAVSSASRAEVLRRAAEHAAWAAEVAARLARRRAEEAAAQYTHV